MTVLRRLLLVLALASLVAAPPLLADREGRNPAPPADRGSRLTPAGRGDQSEPAGPNAIAPELPALRDTQPRITPFCEPVPEKFFISSLGSIATDLGTAGYVIDQPGHYVVTRDLAASNVDFGILIRVGGVKLEFRRTVLTGGPEVRALIRIHESWDATVIGGTLRGARAGIVATSEPYWDSNDGLTLSHVTVVGATDTSVSLERVRNVTIEDVDVSGAFQGISVIGAPNLRIIDSHVVANMQGVRISGAGGRILRNRVEAPDGLIISAGPLEIMGNRIIGGAPGTAAVSVGEGSYFLTDNEVQGRDARHALRLSGHYPSIGMFEGNILSGGYDSTISIAGSGSPMRLTNNVIDAGPIGIFVDATENLIEGNRIRGDLVQCGISFARGPSNVFRGNVVERGSVVCGEENTDGGGNGIGGCEGVDCGTERRSIRLNPGLKEEEPVQSTLSQRTRRCEQGEVVLISSPRPGRSAYGTAGLLIDTPGFYRITDDLTLPGSNYGVHITSPDVTLDFGGHMVRANAYYAALVVGSENVVIRNGELSGGTYGLRVRGDEASAATGLRLERLIVVNGSFSDYDPLAISDVRRIEIINSIFDGVDHCCSVYGPTTGIISGSRFDAAELGLRMSDFNDGIVVDNYIGGDSGLSLGARNHLQRNRASTLSLKGPGNRVEEVRISGHDGDGLFVAETAGSNVVKNSLIGGSVEIWSPENLIQNATVVEGIAVRAQGNRIENNFVLARRCGLDLETEGAHEYRGNVFINDEDSEAVCGYPNIDGGGNVVPAARCGNGFKAVSETCDSAYLESCRSLGFESGEIRCNETCDGFDENRCYTCGDGAAQGIEDCDENDTRGKTCFSQGFEEGALGCNEICGFDYSGCRGGCGNSLLEAGEVCENPGAFWNGDSCQAHGFQGGSLRCNWACNGFTFYDCVGGCGNEQAEGSEQCDQTMHGSQCWRYFDYHCDCRVFGFESRETPGCNDDCTFDFTNCGCGNGVLEAGEVCDVGTPVNETCASQGFDGGILGCDKSCLGYDASQCTGGCGNGTVEGTEECDGQAHNAGCPESGCRCEDFGLGTGRLGCKSNCEFDASPCLPISSPPVCGNARVEAGEACDGTDLAGRTCQDFGFVAGSLHCRSDCTRDLAGCIGNGTCGDGMKRGVEECDEQDFGNTSCQSLGHTSGFLSCTPDCRVNPASCSSCGNGIREGSEGCDGVDLGGQTCGSLGKPFGTLACTSICTFNTSGCIGD